MQLGLAFGGAAVGGTLFGPLGAGAGWLAGSLLGAYLTPSQEGPRIDDQSNLASSYGRPIAIGYGTIRLAGNIIWEGERLEKKHTEGGKGGPGVKTYTYRQSFAVAFAGRECQQLVKLWIDSNLVYSSDSDGTAPTSSEDEMVSEGIKFNFHYGTSDQDVDSIIEAELGVDQSPAYRDIVYLVFDNLDLTPWGGRKPVNIEALITFNSSPVYPYHVYDELYSDYGIRMGTLDNYIGPRNLNFPDPRGKPYIYFYFKGRDGEYGLARINTESRTIDKVKQWDGYGFGYATSWGAPGLDSDGYFWCHYGGGNQAPVGKYSLDTMKITSAIPNHFGFKGIMVTRAPSRYFIWQVYGGSSIEGHHATVGDFMLHFNQSDYHTRTWLSGCGKIYSWKKKTPRKDVDGISYVYDTYESLGKIQTGHCWYSDPVKDKNDWYYCSSANTANVWKMFFDFAPQNDVPRKWYSVDHHIYVAAEFKLDFSSYFDRVNQIYYYEEEHCLLVFGSGGGIAKYDIDADDVVAFSTEASGYSTPGKFSIQVDGGQFLVCNAGYFWKMDVRDLSLIKKYSVSSFNSAFTAQWPHPESFCYWDYKTNSATARVTNYSGRSAPVTYYFDRYSDGGEDLQDVVEDLCTRAGYTV